jgi:hypothetical protein
MLESGCQHVKRRAGLWRDRNAAKEPTAAPHLRTTVLERGVMLHDEGEEIVQYDEVRLCRAAKARA